MTKRQTLLPVGSGALLSTRSGSLPTIGSDSTASGYPKSEENVAISTKSESPSRSFWRRKWVWFLCLTVVVVVIAAVVGGTVGGIVSRRDRQSGGNR
jgi:hypothetical protein